MIRRSIRVRVVAFALVVGIVIVLASCIANAWATAGNGLDRFVGEERWAAQGALSRARSGCADEPGDKLLRRRFRVVSVELLPGDCPRGGLAYRAMLRSYTFFGIPTGEVSVYCNSVNCLGGSP